jgi:exodeoxyribonuclease III
MKILSWNVAGLRAMLKKENLENLLKSEDFDIVCLQETKAEEKQVKLPEEIITKYPYRYWNSTQGTTQRKGLSGTTIWSKTEPINRIPGPEIDEEGRIVTLEFEKFILVCIYTPNSQKMESPRFEFRTEKWDPEFRNYINSLKSSPINETNKSVIITGDFNVAHLDIDIHNPKVNKNKAAGFFDAERKQFQLHLESGLIDVYRHFNPDKAGAYTYWNQLNPKTRQNNKGWRIDYFLIGGNPKIILKECNMLPEIYGSDHCPIYLVLE